MLAGGFAMAVGPLFAFKAALRAMKTVFSLFAIALVLLFAGCSHSEPTAEDLRVARQAIPVNELLLMLRGGYKEPKILNEIKTRRIPAKIDAETEEKFVKSGAGPNLIAALKNKDNALTDVQKEAFDHYQEEKTIQAQQSAQAAQNQALAAQQQEQEERNRRQALQQQTFRNINRNQNAQVSYEVAQRNYEFQRKSLEQRIASQEAEINRLRRSGYNETDLRTANNRLDEYNQQLRNLTPPLR